jgi:hypothetical protein
MTRRSRITLELVGPPLLGAGLVTAWAVIQMLTDATTTTAAGWANQLGMLPMAFVMYTVFAIPCIGLQTLAYTAIMEWRFARGLDPRSWRAVGWSTVLGWASGAVLAFGYGIARKDTWYFFNGMGPAVGCLLGLIIRRKSKPGGAA